MCWRYSNQRLVFNDHVFGRDSCDPIPNAERTHTSKLTRFEPNIRIGCQFQRLCVTSRLQLLKTYWRHATPIKITQKSTCEHGVDTYCWAQIGWTWCRISLYRQLSVQLWYFLFVCAVYCMGRWWSYSPWKWFALYTWTFSLQLYCHRRKIRFPQSRWHERKNRLLSYEEFICDVPLHRMPFPALTKSVSAPAMEPQTCIGVLCSR